MNKALRYCHDNLGKFRTELEKFISIPSVSTDPGNPEEMYEAARWLQDKLISLGSRNTELYETALYPVVYGEFGIQSDDKPTVLLYGHYDVVSPGNREIWFTDPFQAVEKNGYLYGRGAADMKGPLLACLFAIESLLMTEKPDIHIKVVFEGTEEAGSIHIRNFVSAHKELLSSDFAVSADAGINHHDQPMITYGLKGVYGCNFELTGPSQPLHSGEFGGIIDNPNHLMARLIAGLEDERGKITLPGFYDGIIAPSAAEKTVLEKVRLTEEYILKCSGVPELGGVPGLTPLEKTVLNPSMNVTYISGGEKKMAIPVSSEAYITFRLVPGQDPEKIKQSFHAYLDNMLPKTVRLKILKEGMYDPSLIPLTHKGIKTMAKALEDTWGTAPIFSRCPGGIPVVGFLEKEIGVYTVLTGLAALDDNIHGFNERIELNTWRRGIETFIRFFSLIAAEYP